VFTTVARAAYTMVNGKMVVREGQLTTVDERKLAARHNMLAQRLLLS
jgi:8-oxoguanine deaminase